MGLSPLTLEGCSTEGDMAGLGGSVLNHATLVRDSILISVNAISTEKAKTALDNINKYYDKMIAPNDPATVAKNVGLLTPTPTVPEQEERLQPYGLILIRKIIYAKGIDDNIENFRKLFFALGSDVSLFLNLIASTDPFIVVQTRITVRALPPGQWTLDAARTYFSNDAIEQIYTAGNGTVYVVLPQFLSVNKSAVQTALETGVPKEEIVTQLFWLNEINTNSANINRLTDNMGLQGDELTAVLTGTSVKSVVPTTIEDLRTQSDQTVGTTLKQIELLNSRFQISDSSTVETLRKEIQATVLKEKTILLELENKVRFNPIVLTRPQDITDFLKKNKQEDLPYLFASRRSVLSIDFQISIADLNKKISQVAAIPAMSNTVSSAFSNLNNTTVDPDVDSTNQSLIQNECAHSSLIKAGNLKWSDLSLAYQCTASLKVRPTIVPTTNIPVIGYPSADSPSSILVNRSDLNVSLSIPDLFDQILHNAVGTTAVDAITAFVALLKSIRAGVDAIIKPLLDKVSDIYAQIESFLARHLSYFGTASLDSSLLKCALNLNLRSDLPIFVDIPPLLLQLRNEVNALLAQIAKIMDDFLTKYLCLDLNFLNDLLKSTTSFLPSFCKTDTFTLPDALQQAFADLRTALQAESKTYLNFSRNTIKIQASVESAIAKVDTFKQDVACNQTPLNSRFMTQFRAEINPAFGTNPLASVSNSITGAGNTISSAVNSLIPPRG